MKQDTFIATNVLWVKVIGDNMTFGAKRIATMTGTRENGNMTKIIKLKPCPFCGSTDLDFGTYTGTLEGMDYVCCMDCGAEITMYRNGKICLDVLNRWNARSGDNTLNEYELKEEV
jgi:Lar family restriction alleviation protein